MEAEPVLEVRDLVAGYVDEVNILDGLDLELRSREIVAIVGPNGAGKSTLVKTIVGLVRSRRGEILLRGESITHEKPHRIVRKGLGYVPQRSNVFSRMTVEENLRLGCIGSPSATTDERLGNAFVLFPRLAERRGQRAGTLSGGERQMLAMGRTLMAEPTLLLLDEPSAALSPILVDAIFDKIVEINEAGVAILLVEQNARRALEMSDRGYVLDLGRNRFHGSGRELLDDSRVADLYLGGRGRIDAVEG